MENIFSPVPRLLAGTAGLCIPQAPWGQQQRCPELLAGSGLPACTHAAENTLPYTSPAQQVC